MVTLDVANKELGMAIPVFPFFILVGYCLGRKWWTVFQEIPV